MHKINHYKRSILSTGKRFFVFLKKKYVTHNFVFPGLLKGVILVCNIPATRVVLYWDQRTRIFRFRIHRFLLTSGCPSVKKTKVVHAITISKTLGYFSRSYWFKKTHHIKQLTYREYKTLGFFNRSCTRYSL